MSSLQFERRYEFSPRIVWDALVDADLVSGWLAEAVIDPRTGGTYNLRWPHDDPAVSREGRITRFEPYSTLEVTGDGTFLFSLAEVPGGSRGVSTAVTLDIMSPIHPAFAARVTADWLTSLDQLADLLRGHPVDWQNGKRDRAARWSEYFDGVEEGKEPTRPGSRFYPHG